MGNERTLEKEPAFQEGKPHCLVYCSIASWLIAWPSFKFPLITYEVYNHRLNDLLRVTHF